MLNIQGTKRRFYLHDLSRNRGKVGMFERRGVAKSVEFAYDPTTTPATPAAKTVTTSAPGQRLARPPTEKQQLPGKHNDLLGEEANAMKK